MHTRNAMGETTGRGGMARSCAGRLSASYRDGSNWTMGGSRHLDNSLVLLYSGSVSTRRDRITAAVAPLHLDGRQDGARLQIHR